MMSDTWDGKNRERAMKEEKDAVMAEVNRQLTEAAKRMSAGLYPAGTTLGVQGGISMGGAMSGAAKGATGTGPLSKANVNAPEPHCLVCYDAKAREQEVALRREIEVLREDRRKWMEKYIAAMAPQMKGVGTDRYDYMPVVGQAEMNTAISDSSGAGNDGVRRICNKSLPGHPVTLNADETKCWKCGGMEFGD